ncbi:MAG: hypothetical protein M3N29_10040, partial [Chloroflexota bacterium]|nr:hypothetical protein [Chloroflexota bacterium]
AAPRAVNATRPPGAGAGRPSYAYAGIARDSDHVSRLRAAGRRAARSASWPTLGQRLLYALLAWVPLAVVIGYGGAALAGCDRSAAACPPWFVPGQSVVSALALGALVALPRVAFVAAAAGVGTIVSAAATVLALAVLGRQPVLTAALVGSAMLLLAALYLGISVLLLVHRRLLPWYMPPPPAPGRGVRR